MAKYDVNTFQGLILALQDYWAQQGCAVVQPLDMEVGAGTFHPMTFLRSLGPEPASFAYVQPCRRPMGAMVKTLTDCNITTNFKSS